MNQFQLVNYLRFSSTSWSTVYGSPRLPGQMFTVLLDFPVNCPLFSSTSRSTVHGSSLLPRQLSTVLLDFPVNCPRFSSTSWSNVHGSPQLSWSSVHSSPRLPGQLFRVHPNFVVRKICSVDYYYSVPWWTASTTRLLHLMQFLCFRSVQKLFFFRATWSVH